MPDWSVLKRMRRRTGNREEKNILSFAMKTLSHCFICGHVHDELIIECSKDVSLDAICEQMGRTPSWATGLVMRADGYETEFYKKD